MKVIKRGQIPSERIYRCTCSVCNSIIEYKEAEAKVIHDQRDNGPTHNLGACPVCLKALYNYAPRVYSIPVNGNTFAPKHPNEPY